MAGAFRLLFQPDASRPPNNLEAADGDFSLIEKATKYGSGQDPTRGEISAQVSLFVRAAPQVSSKPIDMGCSN